MDPAAIVRILVELTGQLRAVDQSTDGDLRTIRRAIAASVLLRPSLTLSNDLFAGVEPGADEIDGQTLVELGDIVAEVQERLQQPPDSLTDLQAFRRELPASTGHVPASQPPWALDAVPERTFGPFLTEDGLAVWFDLYRLGHPLRVIRAPGASAIVAFLLSGTSPDGATFEIAPGSVWVDARVLAPSAPSGSQVGFHVAGGTLSLSAAAVIVGAQIHIGATTTVTLALKLDTRSPPSNTFGPGGDARDASADLPRDVTFVLAPGSTIITASPARAKTFGTTFRLRPAAGAAEYDALLQRVLIPYESTPRRATIAGVRSGVFVPSGTASIERAAWAIPVVFPGALAVLAERSGNGAMALVTRGLRASWRGLIGPPPAMPRAFILVEPGTLSIVGIDVASTRASQRLDLWDDERSESPRRCTLDFRYEHPAPIVHVSLAAGSEILLCAGSLQAHLDRPVKADGTRLGLRAARAALIVGEAAQGTMVLVVARREAGTPGIAPATPAPIAFALSNALMKTRPADLLLAAGMLQGDADVRTGALILQFQLLQLLPTLPDPYASNIRNPREAGEASAEAQLTVRVMWSAPASAQIVLRLGAPDHSRLAAHAVLPPTLRPADAGSRGTLAELRSQLSEGRRHIVEEDDRRLSELRSRFDDALGSAGEQFYLLDVSSYADQFGVGLGLRGPRSSDHQRPDADLRIDSLSLMTPARFLRAFTVPHIQWEPVWTIQNPDLAPFPSPLASADDGGPTLLGINTVNLVPIAPRPVVLGMVREFQRGDKRSTRAAALFTLAFGMKAVAAPLRRPPEALVRGAGLAMVQPGFAAPKLTGALQVMLQAIDPLSSATVESPSLPGATIQTRNGMDPLTGLPLLLSVIGDNQLNQAETIFNNEFAPGAKTARVPLTRIDFSGYGASLFSHWQNPQAEIAETSKVEFDVIVGRTAYEVVQVRSILYPWGVRVVRTITIQRTGGGGAFRRDSGWVAASTGEFNFPRHSNGSKIETHPGVVKGVFSVRRIRDTTHAYERVYGGPGAVTVQLAAVRFDADVRISDLIVGGRDGFVTSVDQIGFVQLAPSGDPLTPEQYADLIADQGPLGGPVDCLIDVGGSKQHMRLTRVDVGAARTTGSSYEFAAAGRGSPVLPGDGQWSIVRQPGNANQEAEALDRHAGVALVREGRTSVQDAGNTAPYLFADPAGLLAPSLAPYDYGLLWATGTQRILFPRPRIERGAKALTSSRAPLLADSYTLITSSGLFPPANACLQIPFTNWSLDIPAVAQLRLALPQATFPAVRVAGGLHRDLGASSSTRTYIDYTNTRITVRLDSTAANPWEYTQTDIAIVYFTDGGHVKTSRGHHLASSLERSKFTLESDEFGPALDQVKSLDLFSSGSLAGGLATGSGSGTVPLEASEGHGPHPKIGLKLEYKLPIPQGVPVGIGVTTGGYIQLGTDFQNYFKLEMVFVAAVVLVFPVGGKFLYEAELLKKPALPDSSNKIKAGSKHELVFALGVYSDGHTHFGPFDAEWKLFVGVGFVLESKPTTGLAVGLGIVFYAELAISYPNSLLSLVEAGVSVEGQALLLFEGGDSFLVARGKLAFELTVAFILEIEFELPEVEIARLEL